MSTLQYTLLSHLRSLAAKQASGALSDRQLLEAFLTQRSEMSFAALLRRHGPMVWSVCRRLLRNHHDAEDAFQAVFVVFVRKAANIRKQDSVSSFLHGVAYRVSEKLRRGAARRAARERTQARPPFEDPCDDLNWRELGSVLDEELTKLSQQHRAPLVLCYLEGKTQDEAARLLGWSKSTLRRRLEQGRDALGRRLTRRGVTLSAALSAPLVADSAAQAALPPLLAASTVPAGLAAAMGRATSPLVSAQVVALVDRVMPTVVAKKAVVAAVLVASLALGIGGFLAHRAIPRVLTVPSVIRAEAPAQPSSPARSASKDRAIEIQGRVLDPDGKPSSGARLFLRCDTMDKKADMPVRAITSKDGRFRFAAQTTDFDPQDKAVLVAAAKGFGLDWIEMTAQSKDDFTLRLVKDDVPIEGRVVDLEGRPVSGVRVHVRNLVRGDLSGWIKIVTEYTSRIPFGIESEILGASAFAVTGKDGRFRLTGIGRERGVVLTLRSPDIEGARVFAATRRGPARGWRSGQDGMYAAVFDWVAAPCKPIIGTVRDKATGKPVMGIHVDCNNPPGAAAVTDRQGRYRINGIGKRTTYSVFAWGVPYLDFHREAVPDSPGLEPLVVDFQVQRGIAVTGRLIDKETRKPVQGWVHYLASPDNPNRKNFTLIHGKFTSFNNGGGTTKPDGSFQAIALPGPGRLRALPDDTDRYQLTQVPIDLSQTDRKFTTCDILLEPSRASRGSSGIKSKMVPEKAAKKTDPAKAPAEIDRLIKRLGSDDFDEREAASRALETVGDPALETLRKAAADNPDAEIRQRAKRAIQVIERRWELRRFEGPTEPVKCVDLLPDGRRALFACTQTMRLWDAETGKELRRFEGHTGDALRVQFSPNGRQALSGGSDKSARVWDVETGKELHCFRGHAGWVFNLALSLDGRQALSGSADKTLRLWDVETGKELRRFTGHTDEVWSVALSPDGRRALSGGGVDSAAGRKDCALRLWDVETGKELRRFEGHTATVSRLAFSADGRRALSASSDKTVRLWDVETGKEARRFKGHTEAVCVAVFSPDGRRVLSGGFDKTVRLWDIETGKELRCFRGHTELVDGLAFTPDGRRALSGSRDGTLRLWQLPP